MFTTNTNDENLTQAHNYIKNLERQLEDYKRYHRENVKALKAILATGRISMCKVCFTPIAHKDSVCNQNGYCCDGHMMADARKIAVKAVDDLRKNGAGG